MLASDAKAFDTLASRTWHYPVVSEDDRFYQERIGFSALLRNTLVCLPTGMGEAFIGFVVMYNFSRWFPGNKAIFLSPTRPLVVQQLCSWKNMFPHLSGAVTEITASMAPEKRLGVWSKADFIFTTPHILENDLSNSLLDAKAISCLIFDEAHRAVGNYSYCNIMQIMKSSNAQYRVCALSASPGSTSSAIHQVLQNLDVEKVEYLDESDEALQPFLSFKEKKTIIVPKDPSIDLIKNALDSLIVSNYIRPLNRMGCQLGNDMDDITAPLLEANLVNSGPIEGHLACLRIAIRIRDLLVIYGIRSMLNYIQSLSEGKPNALSSRVLNHLRAPGNFSQLWLDFELKSRSPAFVSHPKLVHLKDILTSHFCNNSDSGFSGAIVFSSHQDSVSDIINYLQNFRPLISPMALVGRASGKSFRNSINMANQQVLDKFVSCECNVLVATCTDAEGLEIGAVDLIVFYDATASPIRLTQRFGQTGRQKRDGKVIVLANEVKETDLLKHSEARRQSMDVILKNSSEYFTLPSLKNNPLQYFPSQPQQIRFEVKLKSIEQGLKSKAALSCFPRTSSRLAPSPKLNPLNSCVSTQTLHQNIKPSRRSSFLVKVNSQFNPSGPNTLKCREMWKNGVKMMTPFKIFNHQPHSHELYFKLFHLITDMPDEKCISDNGDSEDDEFVDFVDFFGEGFMKTPEMIIDQCEIDGSLEQLDWSDADF